MWQKSIPQKRSQSSNDEIESIEERERTNCGSCGRGATSREATSGSSRGRNPKPSPKTRTQSGKAVWAPLSPALPATVDEVVEVPLPARCPRCGGGLEECETVSQFQTEIPEPRVSALSFAFLWGAAGVADGERRGDIHGKPRMPSAVPRRN